MTASEITVAEPLAGDAIGNGRYTIRRLIARGGQGLVYQANDRESSAEVVVKILNPASATDAKATARFEREAQRLQGLSHANIVTMKDFGHEGGRSYLVMEYIRGEHLGRYLARHGPLTLEQFVPIAAQILKAVGHVHSRGIMVRDIKPANIMLCEHEGRANFVKLLDFGLAKLEQEPSPITTACIVGTAGFLSPEQIRGASLDVRVDVYAVGVLFYLMLTGKQPITGTNLASVLYKTTHDAPPPLADAIPPGRRIPRGLVELIERCLAKHPKDRPEHADSIVEGLIDVVPAKLFRLPKVSAAQRNMTIESSRPATDIEHTPTSPIDPRRLPEPLAATSEATVAELTATYMRSRWPWFAAVCATLVLGIVVGAWLTSSGEHSALAATRPASSLAAVRPTPPPSVLTTVDLESKPTATVHVDGELMGHTPLRASLAAGYHRVRLEASGHEPWTEELVVETGHEIHRTIALRAKPRQTPRVTEAPARRHSSSRGKSKRTKKTPAQPSSPPSDPAPTAASEPAASRAPGETIAPGQMPRTNTGSERKQRRIDEDVWGD